MVLISSLQDGWMHFRALTKFSFVKCFLKQKEKKVDLVTT